MGLFRLLFFIALIVAAIWIWRRLSAPRPEKRPHSGQSAPMVRCAQCDSHLPQSEALSSEGRWYCSRDHLERGPHTR